MKLFKLIPLLLLFAMASCSSVQVSTDYDNTVNFSQFKTYAFMKDGVDKINISDLDKKRILKETFADLLPEETLGLSKKGFGLPLRIWFQNELRSELETLLKGDFLQKQGLFNSDYVHQLLEEHMSKKENHSSKLWQLFVFQKWYSKNVVS